MKLLGLHHVSALTASAPKNYQFYTEIMGMRLIKKTVNQDDVRVYHLFYGDEEGNAGTEVTFFEIPNAGQTRRGNNSISSLSLRIPNDEALQYWKDRFDQYNVSHEEITEQAGHRILRFEDFEGQRFFLISDEHNQGVPAGKPWKLSPVPTEYAIIGLGPVQLTVPNEEQTAWMLTDIMGMRRKGTYPSTIAGQPDIVIFDMAEGGNGAEIHLEVRTDLPAERLGRGGVHHVAFRVADEEELRTWVEHIRNSKIGSSGFVDRFYFRSLYFREPNGILFELATDGPGFATDEDLEHLGEALSLPPFLEGKRADIEANLKPLDTKPHA
ncbi:ring-cleaving dioxygenase [Paenibacillus massiliensis]|uniref:ring-cleaving dioxygenase n=1 Tax=Paenibacillus massiliensis TaxID=225917 RepID=UPI000425792F|nr:ring-cleaving dioxygenase [Paenibacillus massiliensis]